MPPSLRTRQKWTAMKIVMMKGRNRTCSTYQRSNVSGVIWTPPIKRERHLITEHRGVGRHVGSHRHGPQRQLVPRQQIAGEGQQQGEQQEDDADDPVELARRLVRAVIEDPRHVEEDRQHHEVCSPTVHVAHQLPEGDVGGQRLDVE